MYLLVFMLYATISRSVAKTSTNKTLQYDAKIATTTLHPYSKDSTDLDDRKINIESRKCCDDNLVFVRVNNSSQLNCVLLNNTEHTFEPAIYKYTEMQKEFAVITFNTSNLKCIKSMNEIMVDTEPFPLYLQTDGQLLVITEDRIQTEMYFTPDKYCIEDYYANRNDEKPTLIGLICFTEPKEQYYIVNSICKLISCVFILLTVIVYVYLPEFHHLHGMVLITHLLCFFIAFIFLIVSQIGTKTLVTGTTFCYISAHIIYFSLLAGFFWLNVMCYDIWLTFSDIQNRSNYIKFWPRFCKYCIYAFGIPTILLLLFVIMQNSGLPEGHPMKYNVEEQGCFFDGDTKMIYLYTPILILCVANFVFFTMTAIKMNNIKKLGRSQGLYKTETEKQRFWLYIKLFAVMGINWILEIISFSFPKLQYIWMFTNAYNALIGLIIFLIFVWKKSVKDKLLKRYSQRKGQSGSESRETHYTSTRTTMQPGEGMRLTKICGKETKSSV